MDIYSGDPSEFRISFGKKYKGLKLRDISKDDLKEYSNFLNDNAQRTGQALPEDIKAFQNVLNRYLRS